MNRFQKWLSLLSIGCEAEVKASRWTFNECCEHAGWEQPELSGDSRSVHSRLPVYRPGPLFSLGTLAEELNLTRLYAKDERSRLGLPAFKVLGSSYAVVHHLEKELIRLGYPAGEWSNIDEFRRLISPLGNRMLVTATDGNHGRGVARVARWLGWEAQVFMPRGTATARVEAIRSEGAEVFLLDVSYDDAVLAAQDSARQHEALLVQDTSWPGYEEIPRLIVEGYATIMQEIEESLQTEKAGWPDLILVPFGVGALLGAVVQHLRKPGSPPVKIVTVEPLGAECALESLVTGESVTVPGQADTVMVGLNCGTVGLGIVEPLLRGVDAAIAIEDGWAVQALKTIHTQGLEVGESGASSPAGLMALMQDRALEPLRKALKIGQDTRALVFLTEQVTDPETTARLLAE